MIIIVYVYTHSLHWQCNNNNVNGNNHIIYFAYELKKNGKEGERLRLDATHVPCSLFNDIYKI